MEPAREWEPCPVGLLAEEPLEARPAGSGTDWCSRPEGCAGAMTLGCCCRLSRAKGEGEGAEASAASAPEPHEAEEGDQAPHAPAPPLANRLWEAAAAQMGSSAIAAATAAASAWVLVAESLRPPREPPAGRPKTEPSAEERPLAAAACTSISL